VPSPDGALLVLAESLNAPLALMAVADGARRPLPGSRPGDLAIGWSADGRHLYVIEAQGFPARVHRIEVASGRREPWRELAPADRAGVTGIRSAFLTPDGASYAYGFRRILTDLYLLEGLN
jgi:hypothetical protein